MPAEMGIVSPSQGRFAERLLCARHGSRHGGAHEGKNGAAGRHTHCPEAFGSCVEMGNQRRPKAGLSPLPAAGVQSPRPPQLQILLQRAPSWQGRPKTARGVSSGAVRGSLGMPGWAQPPRHPQPPSQESAAWSWATVARTHAAWPCGSLHRWPGLGLNLAQPPRESGFRHPCTPCPSTPGRPNPQDCAGRLCN